MEMLLGKREVNSWQEEGTYGTAATTVYVFGKNTRLTATEDNAGFEPIMSANSDSMVIEGMEQTTKTFGGTIVSNPQEWRLLKFIFGDPVDTGSNPYTHTFPSLSTANTMLSFTYQRNRNKSTGDLPITYKGCKVNEYTLNWNSAGGGNSGKLLEQSIKFIAQDRAEDVSAASISPPTTDAIKARHVKLTINGSEVVELKSGSLTIRPMLHDSKYANQTLGTLIGEPSPEHYKISGKFTILAKNNTWVTAWKTFAAMSSTNKIEFIRGSNDQLVLTFSNLFLEAVPEETNLEGVNSVDVVFTALNVSAVATDAISSY